MPAIPPIGILLRSHVERRLLPLFLRVDRRIPVEELGFIVWPNWIDPSQATVYSIGVGEDIDVERRLVERGARSIWLFDPTPRAIRHMEQCGDFGGAMHFSPVGGWREDTTLTFHAPADPRFVSYTVMAPQGGTSTFKAEVRTLRTLMRERGHERIDVLKMNVEGAEDAILEQAFRDGIRPRSIICTWEGRWSLAKAVRCTRDLRQRGYRLIGRKDWYCTYLDLHG
jgi:FkbM family methyltransferase